MTRAEQACEQLKKSGYLAYVERYRVEGDGCRGTMRLEALQRLTGDTKRFASGVLYGLHEDVGSHLHDFRSFTGQFGTGSLQIVLDDQTGAFWADVDEANPYEDVVNIVHHTFGEVVPHWVQKLWKKVRGRK